MNSTTPFDRKKALLILLALFTGGAVPIQIVTLSFGYAQYYKGIAMGPKAIKIAHQFSSYYFPLVYIPAIIILIGIIFYSKKHYPDLFRRIVVGLGVGAFATIFLDFFRQMGVIQGWLPGDTPTMFGKMLTGSHVFWKYYWSGVFIHFMNGADFGLIFTLVWGKQRNYFQSIIWAAIWLNMMELGMMLGPPMGPMVGLFGVNYAWPQLFLLTLAAHIAFGTILGIGAHYFLKEEDRKWLLPFVLGK